MTTSTPHLSSFIPHRSSIPHLSSFIPHPSWCAFCFLVLSGLPVCAQDEAGEAPPPVPFAGDGIFNDQPPFLAGVTVDHADFAYREGDRLRVQFMAEREAFLYLIYHQADGQSRLLFPNVSQPENRVPAKQPVVVPRAEQPLRFRIGPPFGAEVLQVLAAVQPVPELDALLPELSGGRQKAPLPTAPQVTKQVIEQLQTRLLKDKTSWTEHRVVLRTAAKAPPSPPRKAARVGLFIGIGKYLHPEFCQTHIELSHSAEVMHELMLKKGGLDPAKTKLVLNEQATKANLQQLITRWLPSVSQPGDVVFLYFSGHAGQFDTTDRSEPDGQDEDLAPYDTSYGTQAMPFAKRMRRHRDSVILDDTLARWLQALSGRQVVFIVDTCHSGGLVEGKGVGNREQGTGNSKAESSVGNALRGVPPAAGTAVLPLPPHPQAGTRGRGEGGLSQREASGDGRQDDSVGNALRGVPHAAGTAALPLPPGEGRGDGGLPTARLDLFTDEAARLKDISQLNTIVITSCATDEQSLIAGLKNQMTPFTFCLLQGMTNSQAPRPLSVQNAFAYSRALMKKLLVEMNAGIEQEPTMTDNVLLPIVLIP